MLIVHWFLLKEEINVGDSLDYSHFAFIKTDLALNYLFETLNYYLNYNVKTKLKLI